MTAANLFEKHYGIAPTCSVFVPGRVNLIGEHTDYNGGLVLPTVISAGITLCTGPSRSTCDQYASSFDGRKVKRVPGAPKTGDWSDYVGGMVDAIRHALNVSTTVEIAVESTLPAGAGVSSSAALMVAVGKALRALFGEQSNLDDVSLARMAQSVENDFIGVPCGIMDQMAVALGEAGSALKLDTQTLNFQRIPCLKEATFVVVHSGIERRLRDGGYAARRKACERAAAAMGVEHLCTLAEDSPLSQIADEDAKACARHVIADHYRVVQLADALCCGDTKTCGDILNAGHQSLSQDFRVSLPEIDALVTSARTLGAYGARLTGGGFGGCIVALIANEHVNTWFADLKAKHPEIRLIEPSS